jgi:type IV secretion system protein VirD4
MCARGLLESSVTKNTEPYWINGEVALLSALFSHVATLSEPTPLTAYRLLTRQTDEQLEKQLKASSSEVAQEQALIFYHKTDPKHRHSFTTGVVNALQFMRDADVARFTSAGYNAPDFGRLRRQPTAVYYCLREQDIKRLQPLTSLFFTLVLEQLAAEEVPAGKQGVPVTMLLDEFANLGKIPDFASTISLSRGRDIAIWIYLQELSQLAARYGSDDAQTIMGTCSTKIALNGLDVRTAEYISRMLGDSTIVAYRESYSDGGGILGGGRGSTTHNRTEHKRPLLTPDEVMRIGENQALVRSGNRHPMWLWKIFYDEKPAKAKTQALGYARSLELAQEQTSVRSEHVKALLPTMPEA